MCHFCVFWGAVAVDWVGHQICSHEVWFLVRTWLHNDTGQIIYIVVSLSPSSIIVGTGQWTVTLCGWEGNLRSGITLTVCYRLQWLHHLQSPGLRKGGEHSHLRRSGVRQPSPFYMTGVSKTIQIVNMTLPDTVPHSQQLPNYRNLLQSPGYTYCRTRLASEDNRMLRRRTLMLSSRGLFINIS